MINKAQNGVWFITFDIFNKVGLKHAFSTKIGGVSEGIYESMNLSFSRGDSFDNVIRNHNLFAEAVGYKAENTVFSDQIHETRIVTVTADDIGKGMAGKPGFKGVDGLATNIPGIPLMTMYADCVPLLFYDPVKKVIGMAHSGWRGTVARIGEVMVEYLKEHFSCNPDDILAAIGPSICVDCYEVSGDVAEEFYKAFPKEEAEDILIEKAGNAENCDLKDKKFQLDLWKANEYVLIDAGILKDHIEVSGICTCHNPDFMISHRYTKGKRGSLAAVMVL